MNAISEKMLEALCCFLNDEKVKWEEGISPEEWSELFRLSMHHHILPMVFEAVCTCPAFAMCPPQLVQMMKSQVIRQVMMQGRKTAEFLELYGKLLEVGVTPLVVKGIVCRSLYREPDYRCSGDEDVLIPREQFHTCVDIFEQNGMDMVEPEMNLNEEGEVPYHKADGMLYIELHKELFPSERDVLGNLNSLFTEVFKRKIRTEVQGVPVYTMCHTDHLLYLILHAFKHFLHSGFGIRQVCDIVMYAQKYGSETDWEYLLERCREIHADVFAASLFDIGEKELRFDPEKACYPESWRSMEADGIDLLEDLLQGGVFGDSSLSRKHSSNITLQAVSRDRRGKRGAGSLTRSLFPRRTYMERTYPWVKSYPFLLPLSWALRIGNYLKETRDTEENDAKASIDIGNHRVDLMRKYKIIQ